MDRIRSYRDLNIWRRAISLAEASYELTRSFPKEETYGMSSQIRRAAVSVAANIAEGYGRETRPAYVSFLRIAQGSLKEWETHLILAERVGVAAVGSTASILDLCDEQGRMLRALIRKLTAS